MTRKLSIIITLALFIIPNFAFAGNWEIDYPSMYVANVYHDGEMIASIQRLSTEDKWSIYCIAGEKRAKNNNLSYKEVVDAFHNAKKKCKTSP